MNIRNASLHTMAALALLVMATGASAQPGTGAPAPEVLIAPTADARPTIDLSAGYTLLHDSNRGGTMPAAWLAGLSLGLTPSFAIVGEADGAYRTEQTPNGRHQYRTHAFMAGARKHLLTPGPHTPFVQVLIGTSCYCGSSVQTAGRHDRGLALQAGLGLDLPVTGAFGVRLQGDYRHVRGEAVRFNQVRLAVGGVISIARR